MPCRNTLQEHDSYLFKFIWGRERIIPFTILSSSLPTGLEPSHSWSIPTHQERRNIFTTIYPITFDTHDQTKQQKAKSIKKKECIIYPPPPPKKKSRNREGTYRCLPLQGRLSPVGCVGAVELDSAPGFSSPPFSEDEMRSGKARVFFYLGCGRNGRDMEAKVEPGKSLAPL